MTKQAKRDPSAVTTLCAQSLNMKKCAWNGMKCRGAAVGRHPKYKRNGRKNITRHIFSEHPTRCIYRTISVQF